VEPPDVFKGAFDPNRRHYRPGLSNEHFCTIVIDLSTRERKMPAHRQQAARFIRRIAKNA
jgi:hypothetical protein